jgi:hypothetical protein
VGERGSCCISLGVDPESRPIAQQEMVKHERLKNWDATAALDVEECDFVIER